MRLSVAQFITKLKLVFALVLFLLSISILLSSI